MQVNIQLPKKVPLDVESVESASRHTAVFRLPESGSWTLLPDDPADLNEVDFMEQTMQKINTSWMNVGDVLIDVETTGLDPKRDSPIEIAAQAWMGERFYARFRPRPGADVDPRALEVTGRHLRDLDTESLGYYEALHLFARWLEGYQRSANGPLVMAGLNTASLDLPMIRGCLGEVSSWAARAFSHRCRDLHDLAVTYAGIAAHPVPVGGFQTDDIYRMLDMDPEPRPHNALNGIFWEAAAFARMTNNLLTLTTSVRQSGREEEI